MTLKYEHVLPVAGILIATLMTGMALGVLMTKINPGPEHYALFQLNEATEDGMTVEMGVSATEAKRGPMMPAIYLPDTTPQGYMLKVSIKAMPMPTPRPGLTSTTTTLRQ